MKPEDGDVTKGRGCGAQEWVTSINTPGIGGNHEV